MSVDFYMMVDDDVHVNMIMYDKDILFLWLTSKIEGSNKNYIPIHTPRPAKKRNKTEKKKS